MAGSVLDFDAIVNADSMATNIASHWEEWNGYRREWVEEKKELRNYLYATDTRTTGNSKLPWSNSTTTPKLTQIYDNLKANYSAALFPNSKWMKWQGGEKESASKDKAEVIEGYMYTKLAQADFERTVDLLIDDYVQAGNCFGMVLWEDDYIATKGGYQQRYMGPRLQRISPYDIVFNPSATSFERTPKIIRSIYSLGEVKKMMERGGLDGGEEIFSRMMDNRRLVANTKEFDKSNGYVADGFSNIHNYYSSGTVELHTFYGDYYDVDSGEVKEHRKIVVADRAYVIHEEALPAYLSFPPIFHSGWRSRPDNLYAMGPLDNLVGMQYRIDHLENLRADVFDQIALPIQKVRGDVEDYDYEPGARIYMGEEGDVSYLVPDATALQADFQIRSLQDTMEEMAGAPRQAMGIRTPGEKTAFEVQSLQNSASRIFQHKATKFEREFLEPVLNMMFIVSRENLTSADIVRIYDDTAKAEIFMDIERSDLMGVGTIKPIGASHFAERAQRVQNINQMIQIKADPTIGVHMSGKEIARLIADELGEDALFGENIGVEEQMETQAASQDAEADAMEQAEMKAEMGL